jgi:apolipoprotein N-acyltransferase
MAVDVTSSGSIRVPPRTTGPQPWRPIFLPALLSSVLLYCSHFPIGLGWLLGWVALVPLLILVRHRGPLWRIYLAAYLCGLAFYTPVLRWLPTTDPSMYFAQGFLALYGSLYPLVGLWLIRWIDSRARWPLALTVPVVWTALEYVKGRALTGFAWFLMGHTQHDMPWLIQVADLGGAWLVSFLVLMVNGYLADLCLAWLAEPRWSLRGLLTQGASVLAVLVLTLGYGAYRLSEDVLRPGPVVALVQTNIQQGYRNHAHHEPGMVRKRINEHVLALTDIAATFHPDLIAWPETTLAGGFFHNPGLPEEQLSEEQKYRLELSQNDATDFAKRWQTSLLLGLNASTPLADGEWERHNSGVFILPDGTVPGVFDKIHCVPFGEYAPFECMAWMMPFPYKYQIFPGHARPRFRLPGEGAKGATFGVLICYEDTDPLVSRPYSGSDGQQPVDFLLNISNDGWFAHSAEHAEHLAICRFRAVESRRSVVRAVNQGISAVVDSTGRVLRPVPKDSGEGPEKEPLSVWWIGPESKDWRAMPVSEWQGFEVKAGVLLATIPLDGRTTLYSLWGDWVPWTCAGIALFGLLAPWRWRGGREPGPEPRG